MRTMLRSVKALPTPHTGCARALAARGHRHVAHADCPVGQHLRLLGPKTRWSIQACVEKPLRRGIGPGGSIQQPKILSLVWNRFLHARSRACTRNLAKMFLNPKP